MGAGARLGADAVRVAFIAVDLCHLLLAGLPARRFKPEAAVSMSRHTSNVRHLAVRHASAAASGTAARAPRPLGDLVRDPSGAAMRRLKPSRRSELIIAFGENAADLAGIAVALAAILLTVATADLVYDAGHSIIIIISALLVAVALAIGAQTRSLLIGESAAQSVRRAIHEFLTTRTQIDRALSLLTLLQGDDVVVAVKVQMQPMATSRELVDAINACEAQRCVAFSQVRWVFFEPDLAAGAANRSRSC